MMNEKQNPEAEGIPDKFRAYLETEKSGEWKQFFLSLFLKAKNDYLDDLPEANVEAHKLGEDGQIIGVNKYKCRGNYISNLGQAFADAIERRVITNLELIGKIEKFRNHDFNYYHNKPTTKEEIDMINQILTEVIEYLKQ